jgi:hypothetical protein
MTQFLRPLYGEYLKDSSIAQAVPLPPGVYAGMVPSIAGAGGSAGWTASLSPDSDGFSYWRTPGQPSVGRFCIQETGAVQLNIEGPDASNPRIDLIIGIHKWVAGAVDPGTLEPFGTYAPSQQATYAVIKGTPASTPSIPVIADPYDETGRRAVILAVVTVPTSGAPTIERYQPTDFRLAYMRSIVAEVVAGRGSFENLPARLDALADGMSDKINAISFKGYTSSTSSGATFQKVSLAPTSKYGSSVTEVDAYTIGLPVPGLYEIQAFHKLEGNFGNNGAGAVSAIRGVLKRTGVSDQILDYQGDTDTSEVSATVYAMVYVDPNWTNVGVYFERAGTPGGYLRGSVKYLGNPLTLSGLDISTGNQTFVASASQAYPDSAQVALIAVNAVGATTWSVVPGANLLDGTTNPKAEIVNGNKLQITWNSAPVFPDVHNIKVRVTDSASPARTANKTITVTFNAPAALAITTSDIEETRSFFPSTVGLFLFGTGGAEPYTWSVVTGPDTTVDSPVVTQASAAGVANMSCTFTGPGTSSVRLRLTDSKSTQVEKVVSIVVDFVAPGCVPAGTPFLLADGTLTPIESVQVGAKAMAFDDKTGERVDAVVTNVYTHLGKELFRVSTDRGSLVCSGEHKLYSLERGAWVDASELACGDGTLWMGEDGMVDTGVLGIESIGVHETVYHVSLDKGHVYVAGGVPAHNKIQSPYV